MAKDLLVILPFLVVDTSVVSGSKKARFKYPFADTHYKSPKEYTIEWLGKLISGEKEDISAVVAYARFINPYSLAWLAEALGEKPEIVKTAMDAASTVEGEVIEMTNAFRANIPFQRIQELFDAPKRWQLDQKLINFTDFKKRNGRPFVKKGYSDEFMRALHKESIYLDSKTMMPESCLHIGSGTSSRDLPLFLSDMNSSYLKCISIKNKPDISVQDMYIVMSFLEPHPPITESTDSWGSMYPSQKGHMLSWFGSQHIGTGNKGTAFAYERMKGNTSTRTAYNRFLNPGGLLWMAEALGENEETLRKAVTAAREAEQNDYRRRCAAFREVIPFERIIELFLNSKGWIYDPNIRTFLAFDKETGAPYIAKPQYQKEYLDYIAREYV